MCPASHVRPEPAWRRSRLRGFFSPISLFVSVLVFRRPSIEVVLDQWQKEIFDDRLEHHVVVTEALDTKSRFGNERFEQFVTQERIAMIRFPLPLWLIRLSRLCLWIMISVTFR